MMNDPDPYFARRVQDARVRVSVRSLCFRGPEVPTQRSPKDRSCCYAFPGGALEVGDSFESRIRTVKEIRRTALLRRSIEAPFETSWWRLQP